MTTAGIIRTILAVDMMMMTALAVFYLRQRRMSWAAYCCWSVIALLVPVLGPFLVISIHPGSWDPEHDLRKDFRRALHWARRLFSTHPSGRTRPLTRLERARLRRKGKHKP